MARRDIEAGRAFVRLSLRDAEFRRALRNMRRTVNVWGTRIIATTAAVAAGFAAITVNAAQAGDTLHKMNIRTGIAVETLSELQFAAEQSGTDIKQLSDALLRMRRRAANATTGTGPAVRALEELGIAADTFSNIDADVQLEILADALNKMESEARAGQLAFEIFGDNWKQILPLLREGSSGIRQLRAEAQRLGFVITKDQAQAAAEFTDAWNELQKQIQSAFHQIAFEFMPELTEAIERITEIMSNVFKAIKDQKWKELGRLIGIDLAEGFHAGSRSIQQSFTDIFKGISGIELFPADSRRLGKGLNPFREWYKNFLQGGGFFDTSPRAVEERAAERRRIVAELFPQEGLFDFLDRAIGTGMQESLRGPGARRELRRPEPEPAPAPPPNIRQLQDIQAFGTFSAAAARAFGRQGREDVPQQQLKKLDQLWREAGRILRIQERALQILERGLPQEFQ